jgi:molybdate transport system substrate-binding protein
MSRAFLVCWILLTSPIVAEPSESLLVFAAASLTEVCQSIGGRYETQTGRAVRFSFAGSSTLARQIDQGAPADAFLSAHPDWIRFLFENQRLSDETALVFASNRLALISRSDLAIDLKAEPGADIEDAFSGRLAIADPAHVPAGRYTRAALQGLGWWVALQGRLAIGHDVRAALAYVQRGACDLGVVYATDARLTQQVDVVATFPDSLHAPIQYVAAAVGASDDSAAASSFVRFLTSEPAQDVLRKAGFLTFTESTP